MFLHRYTVLRNTVVFPAHGQNHYKRHDHIGVRPYEIGINKNIEICRKTSAKDECNNR